MSHLNYTPTPRGDLIFTVYKKKKIHLVGDAGVEAAAEKSHILTFQKMLYTPRSLTQFIKVSFGSFLSSIVMQRLNERLVTFRNNDINNAPHLRFKIDMVLPFYFHHEIIEATCFILCK